MHPHTHTHTFLKHRLVNPGAQHPQNFLSPATRYHGSLRSLTLAIEFRATCVSQSLHYVCYMFALCLCLRRGVRMRPLGLPSPDPVLAGSQHTDDLDADAQHSGLHQGSFFKSEKPLSARHSAQERRMFWHMSHVSCRPGLFFRWAYDLLHHSASVRGCLPRGQVQGIGHLEN